jgi:HlyD family secretion protein
MTKRGWIATGTATLAAVAALVWWAPWRAKQDPLAGLTWGEVTKGDLEVVVSSTGSLEALDSVEVGTQVSGTLASVRVDYNDRVKAGQVLATIDPKLLDAALVDAQATVARNRAQLAQAEADLERQKQLRAAGLNSESDLASYATAVATARASLDSATAQVTRARENRSYATVVSPIDGVVIERAVQAGQTVASSFNTPRLFLLARDLAKMRILAEVDEGDIGQIRVGQTARFIVAAHPDQEFTGSVAQIRLQPTVEQNVVKYTVVVDAANPDGLLLPGMTATIDFEVETAKEVLTVPAAATRIRPTAAMTAAVEAERAARRAQREAGGSGAATGGQPDRGGATGRGAGGAGGTGGAGGEPGQLPADVRRIWIRDEKGNLKALPVKLGLTDGRRVEIRPLFGELAPGTQVVVAAPDEGGAATAPGGRTAGSPRGFRIL